MRKVIYNINKRGKKDNLLLLEKKGYNITQHKSDNDRDILSITY